MPALATTMARTGSGIAPALLTVLALATALGAGPADRHLAARPAAQAQLADDGEPSAADLEDRPEPLQPRTTRDEADQDRLDASVLFAAARAHEHRQDYEKALEFYERAQQAEPGKPAILRHIIVLAFNLDRRAEAARYAQLLESRDPDDAVLLRRLALELTDLRDRQGRVSLDDLREALNLYERAAAVETGEKINANSVVWWMELGRLYYLTEQYALAAEQFGKVEQALANPAELGLNDALRKVIVGNGDVTYQLFGECFLEADRLDRAQAAFEKANEYHADAALLAYNLARVAARRHQPAEALAQLDIALDRASVAARRQKPAEAPGEAEATPDHGLSGQGTEPYELLAQLLTDLGQSDQLIGRLEKLRTADRDNTSLTFFLAETYRKAGKTETAEPLFRHLCNPSRRRMALDAWQSFIALLHSAGRWDDLLPILGQALAQTGGWEPLKGAGKALLADPVAVDGLLEVAREQRAAGKGRDDSTRWLAAGLLATSRQQFNDAGAYFELAIRAAPVKTPELLLTWGMELLAHEQYVLAAEVFLRGCDQQLPPAASAVFYYYMSGALAMADQTDQALVAARRAAEWQPDEIAYQSRIGWILFHAKRYDEARTAYEQVIAKFDNDPPTAETRKALRDARLVLSNVELSLNHPARGEAWLEQLWDEYPADPAILNDLGYSWADHGKHLQRSLRMIEQAVAAEPKNLAYRDSLGWAFYRLGRFGEAVAELRTATANENPDPTSLDHLGDALLGAGQVPAACEVWRQAVAAFDAEGAAEKSRQIQAKITSAASDRPEPAADPPAKPAS